MQGCGIAVQPTTSSTNGGCISVVPTVNDDVVIAIITNDQGAMGINDSSTIAAIHGSLPSPTSSSCTTTPTITTVSKSYLIN